MSVTGGSQDLGYTIVDREEGHIERSITKVDNNARLAALLVKTVSDCGSSEFVDDAVVPASLVA